MEQVQCIFFGEAVMEIRNVKISQDEHGFLCLNDMWRLSGEKHTKSPGQWRKLITTSELIAALEQTSGFSTSMAKNEVKSAIYAKQGKRGGTFAHIILALVYAEYLNPQLGIEVREIALRVYAGDVTVLDEFNKNKQAQIEDDWNRITAREEIKRNNHDLNMILKLIGAKFTVYWSNFHDDGYMGMYDGRNENAIHALKGLRKGQAILDHMDHHELVANMFRTSLAHQYLSKYPVENVARACQIHRKMGEKVRSYLAENGLDMPEDRPAVPSIKNAYKRVRQLEKMRSKGK